MEGDQNRIEELAKEFFDKPFTESMLVDFAFDLVNAGIELHSKHKIDSVARETKLPEPPKAEEYQQPEAEEEKPKVRKTALDRAGLNGPDFGALNI